jgi:hypothetical protein
MAPLRYPVNAGSGDFDPVPAGSHIAVCDMIADLGIQPGSGMFPKEKRKVYLRWQLPNERVEFEKDGKKQSGPRMIGKEYTASMNEKANLRHLLEAWRGRQFTDAEAADFDISAVLGKACMLMVMHTQKEKRTYANVSGIGPLPRGISPNTIIPEGLPVLYPPGNPSTYHQLPEWIRAKIDQQILEEPVNPDGEPGPPDGHYSDDPPEITDDDIPF